MFVSLCVVSFVRCHSYCVCYCFLFRVSFMRACVRCRVFRCCLFVALCVIIMFVVCVFISCLFFVWILCCSVLLACVYCLAFDVICICRGGFPIVLFS